MNAGLSAQETTGGLLHMPCQEIFHDFLKVNSHIISPAEVPKFYLITITLLHKELLCFTL